MARNKRNWDYLVDFYGNYRAVLGSGSKGQQGASGAKGQKGSPGGTGNKGDKGIQGPVGVGQKGSKGSLNNNAFEFKGQVADQASLPTTGNVDGDTWLTADTGNLYSWANNTWIPLGGASAVTVKGQKGEGGTKGQKGDGQKGQKGGPGVDGAKGDAGQKGATGNLPLISTLPVLP